MSPVRPFFFNPVRSPIWSPFFMAGCALLAVILSSDLSQAAEKSYQQQIQSTSPLLHVDFSQQEPQLWKSTGVAVSKTFTVKNSVKSSPGPRGEEYPLFETDNLAAKFAGGHQWIAIQSQQPETLQFGNQDQITIEAWIRPATSLNGTFPYIVGKGRTHNAGYSQHNQNYALRLAAGKNSAPLSFFFVDEAVLQGGTAETHGHRWTSRQTVPLDGHWHHVAIAYEFGKPETIVGYIDGKPSDGNWDLAGPTTTAPIQDNDELWVGSSMQGSNTFQGEIDEIVIHRRLVSATELASRYAYQRIDYLQQLVTETVKQQSTQNKSTPDKSLVKNWQVDIYEGISSSRNWEFRPTDKLPEYQLPVLALSRLPFKYTQRGIRDDRKTPFLLHIHGTVRLPAGQQELVLRSLNAARLYVDGELLAETSFMNLQSSAHGMMHELKPPADGELSLPAAQQEQRVIINANGQPQSISVLAVVGHSNLPALTGELLVAAGAPGQTYQLLGTDSPYSFTDSGWLAFLDDEAAALTARNQQQRLHISQAETAYWDQRHQRAQQWLETQTEIPIPSLAEAASDHPIDLFVAEKIVEQQDYQSTSLISDEAFLRRLCLDLTGLIPTEKQLEEFISEPVALRREYAIERLLNHNSWADHWVPYWQDVLAENPGLTKPMLNNSGPFRWYLHEAFSDNRSFDRIVTELILMEGSEHNGGTAGFRTASNNDVPMAAKAHIIGTAFLGVEMKCARCHDAPYHESLQEDLFSLAAMLERKEVAVPLSSSIPGTPEQLAHMPVQVTLKPGEKVDPHWPFAELISAEVIKNSDLLRDPANTRSQLALLVTHHENKRFAEMAVNRVWQRLIGRGIVEPLEDWETGVASHPELLSWLAAEFVKANYDLKQLTRLIVTSRLYQQQSISGNAEAQQLFVGPTRRKMTAEQIVDSLYLAVGKPLPAERLTYNSDGRQQWKNFLDFGTPQRAWEMVAIGNERERPSMNLPNAQNLADLLTAYGWRSERQDPLTKRENLPTPLQPLALANGSALNRAIDIAEFSEMVEVCVQSESAESLLDQFFLRVLSRRPDAQEQEIFLPILQSGFSQRLTDDQTVPVKTLFRSPLTWTYHFDPAASVEGLRQLEVCEQGDLPTHRLQPEWRKKAEDVLWTLFNTPEFVFVP